MNTTQYLDAVKRKLGVSSDYALAVHLQITRFGVSKLRRGRVAMSATTAARVAELLELDPLKVIADAELERGSNNELWLRIRDAATLAALAIGAASFGFLPAPAEAASSHNQNVLSALSEYTLRRKWRLWWRQP